jgi:hypothetical protein
VKKCLLFGFALLLLAGCSSKLETGYEPNRLDMSLSQRKALYADPFSPQATEAQHDSGQEDQAARNPTRQPGSY